MQISKVAIVISANSSAFVNFSLNLCVAVCIAILSGTNIQLGMLWALPLLIVELILLTLGLGFFLATLFVRYRDFSHIWEVVLQILFYATPIIYSLKNPGETISKLISLNPLAQIIQDVRHILVTTTEPTTNTLIPFGRVVGIFIVLIVFVAGLRIFQSRKDYFAEEL